MHGEELVKLWESVGYDLKSITETRVERAIVMESNGLEVKHRLLCFCKASSRAYAAAVYLLQTDRNNEPKVDLLFSKTRLAPLKDISIPRLELLAVLIGVRCVKFVKSQLNYQIDEIYLMTDSQCVLQWIKSKKDLSVFVRNRVKEIRENDDIVFRHIVSKDNPADVA